MSQTYRKAEKLKSKKRIEQLFIEGASVKAYPLRAVFMPNNLATHQVGVSVSKRNHKLAVTRNRVKRLMREAYRKNKLSTLENLNYSMLIIYTSREISSQEKLNKAMQKLLLRFKTSISKVEE